MDQPVRLGIVGCGKHAYKSHAKLIAGPLSSLFSIVAVYDPDAKARERILDLFPSGSIAEALRESDVITNPDIEAVLIATPPHLHLDLMEQSLAAKKHVFCEKPLWDRMGFDAYGDAYFRGSLIVRNAARENLVLTSCHPRRFEPEYVELKENLGRYRAEFGNVTEAMFRFFYHVPPSGWKQDENLLFDHMNHEIDLIHFLFGHGKTTLQKITNGFDRYQVVGRREDGMTMSFNGYRRLETKTYRNEFELLFEQGRVLLCSILRQGKLRVTRTVDDFELDRDRVCEYPERSYDVAFLGIMRNFAQAIRGREKNYLEPRDLIINTDSCNALAIDECKEYIW